MISQVVNHALTEQNRKFTGQFNEQEQAYKKELSAKLEEQALAHEEELKAKLEESTILAQREKLHALASLMEKGLVKGQFGELTLAHQEDLKRLTADHEKELSAKLEEQASAHQKELQKLKVLQPDLPGIDTVSGMLHWPELLESDGYLGGFHALIGMLVAFQIDEGMEPSECWKLLNQKNLDQLITDGYCNFKRTIGCNYFNFLVQEGDPQLDFLLEELPEPTIEKCRLLADQHADDPELSLQSQFHYRLFTYLLWHYALERDASERLMGNLVEPREGNPIEIQLDGQLISADMANAYLEYRSIREEVSIKEVRSALEIGGGHGRDAYVMLKASPRMRYVLVDIPPALYLAQRYLGSQFPERNVFAFRPFDEFEEIEEEWNRCNLHFLLPHQLEKIPPNTFDLAINISSFGEMRTSQIEYYIDQIGRTTKGFFYTKQWKQSPNPFDNLVLEESDYRIPEAWEEVYSRDCAVQTKFFEALYRL